MKALAQFIAGFTEEKLLDKLLDATLCDSAHSLIVAPILIAEWNRRHPEDPWGGNI
jgi:hypothetical protein